MGAYDEFNGNNKEENEAFDFAVKCLEEEGKFNDDDFDRVKLLMDKLEKSLENLSQERSEQILKMLRELVMEESDVEDI